MLTRPAFDGFTPEQAFIHLAPYRVVICSSCRYAIPPAAVGRHLREHHRVPHERRRPFVDYVQNLDLMPDPVVATLSHQDPFPVPALPVYDGLQCRAVRCGHLCLTEKRMRDHWSSQHASLEASSAQPRWQQVPVQSFCRGNRLRYFTGPANCQRDRGDDEADALERDLSTRVQSLTDQDKVVLDHYTNSTCSTLATDAESDRLWRTTVLHLALQHDFLLNGLLALASLHLAYLENARRKKYVIMASGYQDEAMPQFRSAISDPNTTNCHAILAFSHLLVLYSLATEQQDEDLFLVNECNETALPLWLHFIHAGCSMLCGVWGEVETGPCKLLASVWDAPVPFDAACKDRYQSLLDLTMRDVLVEDTLAEQQRSEVESAVTSLAAAFAFADSSGQSFTTWDALRIWPMRVSESFMTLLTGHTPAALLLLAHYAILLQRIECHWYFEGRAARLMRAVVQHMDPRWQPLVWRASTMFGSRRLLDGLKLERDPGL